jgi:hypothetical protein
MITPGPQFIRDFITLARNAQNSCKQKAADGQRRGVLIKSNGLRSLPVKRTKGTENAVKAFTWRDS